MSSRTRTMFVLLHTCGQSKYPGSPAERSTAAARARSEPGGGGAPARARLHDRRAPRAAAPPRAAARLRRVHHDEERLGPHLQLEVVREQLLSSGRSVPAANTPKRSTRPPVLGTSGAERREQALGRRRRRAAVAGERDPLRDRAERVVRRVDAPALRRAAGRRVAQHGRERQRAVPGPTTRTARAPRGAPRRAAATSAAAPNSRLRRGRWYRSPSRTRTRRSSGSEAEGSEFLNDQATSRASTPPCRCVRLECRPEAPAVSVVQMKLPAFAVVLCLRGAAAAWAPVNTNDFKCLDDAWVASLPPPSRTSSTRSRRASSARSASPRGTGWTTPA